MQLVSHVLKDAHPDLLREVLNEALVRFMDAEVGVLCQAGYGERTEERVTSRNGYRERPFETRLGSLELKIPKLRQGSYLPSFLEPRRRWEKAFVNVVSEAYVKGVSTRKVEDLVEAMGAKGMSRSEVSRMAQVLDGQVDEFRQRQLDVEYPYLWLDALYIKVREGTRVVSKAVLVAYGVNQNGEREVIGLGLAYGEMYECWKRFLEGLLERGLRGTLLVISDSHTGLKKAIQDTLVGTTWQRCTVHFMRNVLSSVGKAAQGFAAAALRTIFSQTNLTDAKKEFSRAVELLEKKFPAAAEVLIEAEEDVLAYMSFPEKHWRQIHSTNPLERLNKEIRRRTNVVGIFPTNESTLRLIGMLLVEQNDEWAVGRRYFCLESMKLLPERCDKTKGALVA
ncbi:IS256 family transposase [bacterium]|nr:IS256 family transposase [bacterium]